MNTKWTRNKYTRYQIKCHVVTLSRRGSVNWNHVMRWRCQIWISLTRWTLVLYPSTDPCIPPLIPASLHWSLHPSTDPCIPPLIPASLHWSLHPSTDPCIPPLIPASLHSSLHPSTDPCIPQHPDLLPVNEPVLLLNQRCLACVWLAWESIRHVHWVAKVTVHSCQWLALHPSSNERERERGGERDQGLCLRWIILL